jgi:hypothetical protein
VTHSGEITQEHVAALRQHFNHIVPTWGRSPDCAACHRASCGTKAASVRRTPKRKARPFGSD